MPIKSQCAEFFLPQLAVTALEIEELLWGDAFVELPQDFAGARQLGFLHPDAVSSPIDLVFEGKHATGIDKEGYSAGGEGFVETIGKIPGTADAEGVVISQQIFEELGASLELRVWAGGSVFICAGPIVVAGEKIGLNARAAAKRRQGRGAEGKAPRLFDSPAEAIYEASQGMADVAAERDRRDVLFGTWLEGALQFGEGVGGKGRHGAFVGAEPVSKQGMAEEDPVGEFQRFVGVAPGHEHAGEITSLGIGGGTARLIGEIMGMIGEEKEVGVIGVDGLEVVLSLLVELVVFSRLGTGGAGLGRKFAEAQGAGEVVRLTIGTKTGEVDSDHGGPPVLSGSGPDDNGRWGGRRGDLGFGSRGGLGLGRLAPYQGEMAHRLQDALDGIGGVAPSFQHSGAMLAHLAMAIAGGDLPDGVGHGFDASRRNEQAVELVPHEFDGGADDGGCNHGQTACDGFVDDQAPGFKFACVDQYITGVIREHDLIELEETEPFDPISQRGGKAPFQFLAERAVAGDDEVPLRARRGDASEGLENHIDAFDAHEASAIEEAFSFGGEAELVAKGF